MCTQSTTLSLFVAKVKLKFPGCAMGTELGRPIEMTPPFFMHDTALDTNGMFLDQIRPIMLLRLHAHTSSSFWERWISEFQPPDDRLQSHGAVRLTKLFRDCRVYIGCAPPSTGIYDIMLSDLPLILLNCLSPISSRHNNVSSLATQEIYANTAKRYVFTLIAVT